jgi:predicted peptidase
MTKLKPLVLSGFFALLFTLSCKKAIEKKAENMIMDAITNGEWIVEQYIENGNNISSQFLNYSFKFNSNGTVTGTINSTSTNGTWVANATDYTITAEFPSAGDPLKKINGLWKIKDSYWDYVKAEMTTSSGTNVLTLRKK